jgi:hypothetical protein
MSFFRAFFRVWQKILNTLFLLLLYFFLTLLYFFLVFPFSLFLRLRKGYPLGWQKSEELADKTQLY